MKKSIILALFISSVFQLGISQNLELVDVEKFDFQEVYYEKNTGFNDHAIICNHKTDLSHFGFDFDPMGIFAGSLFFKDDDEIFYSGTFKGESEVRLYDININESESHQTILLDLNDDCSFISPNEEDLNFVFPQSENITGIINYSFSTGMDSFWTTYILSTEMQRPKLWSAGDLTIINGTATDEQLQYVNPDGSVIDIHVYSGLNQYLIAIDKFGVYQWSFVLNGYENEFDVGNFPSIVMHNDEIVVAFVQVQTIGNFSISKLFYLDSSGNEIRDRVEFPFVNIIKLDIDNSGRMMMCGVYREQADDTNFDLNGGEFFLDVNPVQNVNGFFLQYSPNGDVNWAQTVESPIVSGVTSFDYYNEYIYLTGLVAEQVIFDINGDNTMTFENLESANTFISKYSLDGNLEWATVLTTEEEGSGGSEISVNDDKISIFGWFNSKFDADPDPDEEHIISMENLDINRSFFVLNLVELPVSTSDINTEVFTLSPNPANSILKTANNNEKIISINSISGVVLKRYNSSSIDISDLPNGMYIVNIENDSRSTSQLISIIH